MANARKILIVDDDTDLRDTLVEQRILEAHARGGDEAVITGWAALRLQGGGFFDGLASVQDGGAQHAAELIAPRDGERILDACAAPGGKAAHRPVSPVTKNP